MGAVPGSGFLTQPWFDVDRYRTSTARRVVVWRPEHTALVLGSTQRPSVVEAGSVPVLRRRSGGGAVMVVPDETIWIDAWVPRHDPLWQDDVVRAAEWAGEWWAAGLRSAAGTALEVHRGRSEPRRWADLVCFAGIGPGEVLADGRKLVGLAQWRSREGALFQGCCYRRWDPAGLLRLLRVDDPPAAEASLRSAAIGLEEMEGTDLQDVTAALLDALPGGPPWQVDP